MLLKPKDIPEFNQALLSARIALLLEFFVILKHKCKYYALITGYAQYILSVLIVAFFKFSLYEKIKSFASIYSHESAELEKILKIFLNLSRTNFHIFGDQRI